MLRTSLALILTASLAGIGAAQTAQPELAIEVDRPVIGKPVFSESFTGENKGRSAFAYEGFRRWQVNDGTVDLLFSRNARLGDYVDLGGSTRNPGEFRTEMPILFLPNVRYAIRFDYFSPSGQSAAAQVKIGERQFRAQTKAKTPQRFSATFVFEESTQVPLIFRDLGRSNVGLGIDNIEIVPVEDLG